jgi:hypothetical protein
MSEMKVGMCTCFSLKVSFTSLINIRVTCQSADVKIKFSVEYHRIIAHEMF